jgi:hypothetical protein
MINFFSHWPEQESRMLHVVENFKPADDPLLKQEKQQEQAKMSDTKMESILKDANPEALGKLLNDKSNEYIGTANKDLGEKKNLVAKTEKKVAELREKIKVPDAKATEKASKESAMIDEEVNAAKDVLTLTMAADQKTEVGQKYKTVEVAAPQKEGNAQNIAKVDAAELAQKRAEA